MSSPPNPKLASTKSIRKTSAPRTPPKNPHLPETQMVAFLKAVESTPYGPILCEIAECFKKRVKENDDFVRQMKNRLQVIVDEHREMQEKEVEKWFDNAIQRLKFMSTRFVTIFFGLMVVQRFLDLVVSTKVLFFYGAL
jgi:hypothetical protein